MELTTVAFVSYYYQDIPRRVGPLPQEDAETFAKEVARREFAREVIVEEWGLIRSRKMEKP